MPDFWKMLEIEPTKDVAIIKRAYAALAKKISSRTVSRRIFESKKCL